MPTILEETDVSLERVDLNSRSPIHKNVNQRGRVVESTRAKGMHLSGVLRYVAVESGLLKVAQEIDEEELPLRMALGLAWEEFAVSLYPEIDWQPGEVTEDGIAMNCDGLSQNIKYPSVNLTGWQQHDPSERVQFHSSTQLEEFKLTWKKIRSGQEMLQEWYWMQQGRGYCWGYDARLVRWHVCYLNGDYRGSGPIYRRYLIQFSNAEVDSTRRMIEKHKDAAEQAGHAE
jgi:hypothetical protein